MLRLAEEGGAYRPGEGITGWIAEHHKPVLSVDPASKSSIMPKLSNSSYNSFVGVPLEVADELIGTFELASTRPGAFSQKDVALLQAISKQVAISIYNAELYAAQSRHLENLTSLQQVMDQDKGSDYVHAVYKVLSERLAQLIDADMCGILVYDEQKQALVPQIPFYGIPDQVSRQYSIPIPVGSPQRMIWEKQQYWISNDVTDEPMVEAMGLMSLVAATGVYNTALVPLEVGAERMGVIQISNKAAEGGFTLRDMQTLRILAAQAAAVVENTRLYEREQSRETELMGLQEITHTISAFSNENELMAEINSRIAHLMQIEICGILLYDEETRRLVARPPFYGVADEQVADYVIPLEMGTSIEAIWRQEDVWHSNAVASDRVIIEASLESAMAALGIRQTIMVPLSIGGRRLGLVQAANTLDEALFDDDDVRLLAIFATQAAAIIENARLYRDLARRAAESEGLRRIAELAGSVLTADEPLTPVLAEIAQVMHSPIVFVNVLSEFNDSLITYPRYIHGIELGEVVIQEVNRPGGDSQVAISRQVYRSENLAEDAAMLTCYEQLAGRIGLGPVLIMPLIVGDRSLGELGIANRKSHPYDADDQSTLMAIVVQIAGTLDRITQYQSAGQNLNRRMRELDAVSRVSNELTLTLDLDHILNVILDEAIKATGADAGTVALLKPADEWPDSGTPVLDQRLGGDGWSELAPIENAAVERSGDSVLVNHYDESSLSPMPEAACSALAVAFLYEDKVVGVIHLYHEHPHNFDDREAEFVRTLAAKATLGYGNAIRYQDQIDRNTQLRRRVEQLNQIFELGQILQSNIDPPTMLEAIAYSVMTSIGFDVVLMLLLDEDSGAMRRVAHAGLPLEVYEASKSAVLSLDTLTTLEDERYRVSESYFFPVNKRKHWSKLGDLSALSTAFDGQRVYEPQSDEDWHNGDLLVVPLSTPGGSRVGLMVLNGPQDQRRPSRFTIELLEIFAHQASNTIENTRLYLQSLNTAEQQARLNEIMEAIASTLDIPSILQAVVTGALPMVPFMRMTVALLNADRQIFDVIRLVIKADNSVEIENEVWASLDLTALGRSYEDGETYLYHFGDDAINTYDDLSAWHTAGERTTMVVPLVAGGERLGAMHLGSDLVEAFGFEEYRPFVQRLANLASIAIQNTRLLQHAVNLRQFNELVVQSIQQGIVVLDKSGRVITINAFMRDRYGWDNGAIGQDLFEYRPSLRSVLFKNVQQTLEEGALQEHINLSIQVGDQFLVCNFYLYPLGTADNVRGVVLLLEDLTERAQLEQDLEARASQLAALTEVSSRITSSLDHSEVVALALSSMGQVIQYDTLTFWLRDGEFLYLRGAKDYEDETMPLETKVRIRSHERLRKVVESKQVYSISRLQGWDTLPGERGAQSWMGVPLVSQGNVEGVIALCKQESSAYDEQAEQAAFAFANQVAVALANADLFREAERRTQRLSLLNRVSVALGQSLDSEDILEIALREIAQVLHVDHAFGLMFERDLQLGRVVVEHPRGDSPPDQIFDLRTSAMYQYIRRTVKSLIIEDLKQVEDEDLNDILAELAPRLASAYVLIPMAIGGQVIGAFELLMYEGRFHFDHEQTDLGRIIANQAAIAIQNTSLLEQTLVRSRELETLLEAAQATSLTLDLQEVYHSVVELMMHALDMDDCALMTWDDVDRTVEVQVDVNRNNEPARLTPQGTRFNLNEYPSKQHALEERQVVVLSSDNPDISDKERQELEAFGDIAQMLVPLVVRDASVGLVQLELQAEYRTFTHREIRLAQALGSQAATAIENARLSTETANRVEELYIINDLSQAISSTISIDRMIEIVRGRVPGLLRVEEMYLALYNSETQEIRFPLYVKNGEHQDTPSRQLNDDEVSFIIRNRRPLSIGSDYFGPDELRRSLGIRNAEGDVKSYLGVPLISGDEMMGVLAVRDTRRKRAFGVNSQGILTTIAAQLGTAIQNAYLFNRLRSVNEELSSLNQNLEGLVTARTDELSRRTRPY